MDLDYTGNCCEDPGETGGGKEQDAEIVKATSAKGSREPIQCVQPRKCAGGEENREEQHRKNDVQRSESAQLVIRLPATQRRKLDKVYAFPLGVGKSHSNSTDFHHRHVIQSPLRIMRRMPTP